MGNTANVKPGPNPAVDEAPAQECPPCKAGAPAWMATFADMATLLMAFFVLILSFAHLNVPKYKQVSGSMRSAFGVQTKVPVVEPPTADSLISKHFRSSVVSASAVKAIEEMKTDQPQPQDEDLDRDDGAEISELNAARESLEQSLQEFIAEGKVKVTTADYRVSVELMNTAQEGNLVSASNGMPAVQITRDTIAVLSAVAQAQTQTDMLIEVIESTTGMERQQAERPMPGASVMPRSVLDEQYRQIRANLSDEISRGLAEVAMDGDQIIIRLSEQATFDSGRAQLKPDFHELIDKVGRSVRPASGLVTIEGHTDNVPIGFGARYRNNWDLSAARAAAVADYLLSRGFLEPGRVSVKGYADTQPLKSNDDAEGRASNRRIEVVVTGY